MNIRTRNQTTKHYLTHFARLCGTHLQDTFIGDSFVGRDIVVGHFYWIFFMGFCRTLLWDVVMRHSQDIQDLSIGYFYYGILLWDMLVYKMLLQENIKHDVLPGYEYGGYFTASFQCGGCFLGQFYEGGDLGLGQSSMV